MHTYIQCLSSTTVPLAELLNHVAFMLVEVMASISEYAQTQLRSTKKVDWESCITAATASNPACMGYAHLLSTFVKLYSGGDGAPIIRQLDSFSKQHSQSLTLGEDFFDAVVNMKFGETTPCPRVRSSFLAASLTAAQHSNGVAKLLTKTDFTGLKGKAKLEAVHALEKDTKTAEDFCTQPVPSILFV